MKKEKIEKLIREALNESTFILRSSNKEVTISKEYSPVVTLDKTFNDGIDLEEGEDSVIYNIWIKYVKSTPDGEISSEARINNKSARITPNSAIIDEIFYID